MSISNIFSNEVLKVDDSEKKLRNASLFQANRAKNHGSQADRLVIIQKEKRPYDHNDYMANYDRIKQRKFVSQTEQSLNLKPSSGTSQSLSKSTHGLIQTVNNDRDTFNIQPMNVSYLPKDFLDKEAVNTSLRPDTDLLTFEPIFMVDNPIEEIHDYYYQRLGRDPVTILPPPAGFYE